MAALFARRSPLPALLAILTFIQPALAEEALAGDTSPRLKFAPIYQLEAANGKHQLVTEAPTGLSQLKPDEKAAAFLAVTAEDWPAGLVPLFGVEKNDQFELRRRPLKGQENFTAPLFFALPAEDETESAKVAGRWECVARHADGARKYLGIEFAVEGEHIAGRFDQNTDYRFGFITGGTFRTNRIELKVEYIMDRYTLIGDWHDGRLSGHWRHDEDADHGTWEATRPAKQARLEQPSKAVLLYEWRRASDGARRYSIEADLGKPGWERTVRPLCRVWRK